MKKDNAVSQARAQITSICEMVAALQCDYERLEELREERDTFAADLLDQLGMNETDGRGQWAKENPDEAEELAELESAAGDCEDEDEARQRIEEDALSVEVRSDWVSPGEEMTAGEFRIVLCTGGPHVELVGDLERGEPSRVRMLYRDWGESGELFDFDRAAVLAYCACFFFGE